MIESIKFSREKVEIIDQTLLPKEEKFIRITSYFEMVDAIKKLKIRGAPAIGIAAAAGLFLATKEFEADQDFRKLMNKAFQDMENSRPTAVNLFKTTEKFKEIYRKESDKNKIAEIFYKETLDLMDYEKNACKKMGENSLKKIDISKPINILTHCNTGSLATYGIGTALGVIRTLAQKTDVHVYADETRPLLQGSRLTMWELEKSEIPATLISDNMAAHTIKNKKIDMIITGADRIAANGDSANKIGTYNLAILAKYHNIPFYIVAPESTIDSSLSTGNDIPIEERGASEVRNFGEKQTSPENCEVYSPAFDVTPAELITGIITDKEFYKKYNF